MATLSMIPKGKRFLRSRGGVEVKFVKEAKKILSRKSGAGAEPAL